MKKWAIQSAKTAGSVSTVNSIGVPELLRSKLPNNAVGSSVATGAAYAVAADALNIAADIRKSKLMNGRYLAIADDVGFYGVSSYIGNETRAIDRLHGGISSISPFSSETNLNLTEGAFVAGVTMAADAFDIGTGKNMVFDWIRRPVTTSMLLMK